MTNYYVWITIFAVVTYFIVSDENVATAFFYVIKLLQVNYQKQKWWLIHNPRNPVVKYLMWRRAMKLAKELEQEFGSNAK